MKKLVVIIAGLTLSACSQNPATNLSAAAPLAGAAGIPGVGTAQNVNAGPLVQKLNESLMNMSMAQKLTLEAFKIKDKAELAGSDAEQLKSSNSINPEIYQRTEECNKLIDDRLASNKKLDAEGKKKLSQAMPFYSKSMLQSAGLGMQMSQAVATISANPMALASGPYKANELITVFTSSPKLLSNMAATTHRLTTYASKNGIDTKEVEAASKDLK